MSRTKNRLKKFFLTLMCLSPLLYNGCTFTMPKMSKSSRDNIEEEKAYIDESSVMNEELKIDETDAKQVMPFAVTKRPENNPFNTLGKGYLTEGPSVGMEMADGDEQLKGLKKVKRLEDRLKEEEKERKKTDILVNELNKKITALQAIVAKHGAGYLADGSTIGLGIVDGDDELKVLKKVKRLEARLVEEENKIGTLNNELADLQSAKEAVENNFANTVKSMQEKSNDLLEKASAMESTAKKAEARAIAAEQALNPIKKELIKLQIADTKVQQELYKLKIEKLKRDEE